MSLGPVVVRTRMPAPAGLAGALDCVPEYANLERL